MRIYPLRGNPIVEEQLIIGAMATHEDTVFVVDTQAVPLCSYIESLGLNDLAYYKLKICKEVKITAQLCEENGESKQVESLSQILSAMEKDQTYSLIVREEDAVVAITLMQQLVYIGIPLEQLKIRHQAQTLHEETIAQFMRGIDKRITLLETGIERIALENDTEEATLYKKRILDALETIKVSMEEAKQVEINVTVAAAHSEAKDLLVNCMIDEAIVPSGIGFDLPTTCIYRVSPDEWCHVGNGEKSKAFSSRVQMQQQLVGELGHIRKEISRVLQEVTPIEVRYPSAVAQVPAYAIADTPGISPLGVYPHEAALVALASSDVTVYCIDYQAYLGADNEEYLRKICERYDTQKQASPIIFVVNHIEQHYQKKKHKSVVAVLDGLREQLGNIGYVNYIVMGISAKQYFDAMEVERIPQCEGLAISGLEQPFMERLEGCVQQYLGQPEMTMLTDIEEQVKRLAHYEGIVCHSLEDMKCASGIVDLRYYMQYIAKSQPSQQRLGELVGRIEREYSALRELLDLEALAGILERQKDLFHKGKHTLKTFSNQMQCLFIENISDNEIAYNSRVHTSEQDGSIIELVDGVNVMELIKKETEAPCIQLTTLEEYLYRYLDKLKPSELSKQYLVRLKRLLQEEIEHIQVANAGAILTEQELYLCLDTCTEKASSILKEQVLEDAYYQCMDRYQERLNSVLEEYTGILYNRIMVFKQLVAEHAAALGVVCEVPNTVVPPTWAIAFEKNAITVEADVLNTLLQGMYRNVGEQLITPPTSGFLQKFLQKLGIVKEQKKDGTVDVTKLEQTWELLHASMRLELQDKVLEDFVTATNDYVVLETRRIFKEIHQEIEAFNQLVETVAADIAHCLDHTDEILLEMALVEEKQALFKLANQYVDGLLDKEA